MKKILTLFCGLFLIISTPFVKAENVICGQKVFCSQMKDCKEAIAYLRQCPNPVKIDGDGDGIPCEKQHCGHFKKRNFFKKSPR